MSQGEVHRYTRTLAGRCITGAPATPLILCATSQDQHPTKPASGRHCSCRSRCSLSSAVSLLPFLPAQTAQRLPCQVASGPDKTTSYWLPAADSTRLPTTRCFYGRELPHARYPPLKMSLRIFS